MFEDNLSNFLREKRVSCDLTQHDVARKLGYTSPQFISNWERGLSCPPVNIIAKLSDMYKVSETELFELILSATVTRIEASLRQEFKSRRKKRA